MSRDESGVAYLVAAYLAAAIAFAAPVLVLDTTVVGGPVLFGWLWLAAITIWGAAVFGAFATSFRRGFLALPSAVAALAWPRRAQLARHQRLAAPGLSRRVDKPGGGH
jgi:hypothetical protein